MNTSTERSGRIGRSSKLAALVVGLALLVVACTNGNSSDDAAATAGAITDEGDEPTTTTAEAEPVELISPTETDRPLDLSGGVQSSSDGVTVVDGEPRDGLSARVAEATAPWETDWSRRTVDVDELILGIGTVDPRDVIRPIDVPRFEPIQAATWLDDREPGALVQFNDEVRLYPLSILTQHEIVNDRFGDIPVAVTYCPLCNTALTFDTRVDGRALRFGVSGLLRRSDLVMWDDATTTLWQQITGEAIVGELAGTRLELIPTSIVSYGDARESFPDALSLSQNTGFNRAYGSNPYERYSSSPDPFLFDGEPDPRFRPLARVVGVALSDTENGDKAYPFSVISEERAINDQIGDTPILVLWGGDTADALDSRRIAEGAAIGSGIAFDRRIDGQTLTFSPTGDDLFTDAETGTTWNLLGQAVDGPLAGEQLATLPHRNEFWFAWASFFPDAPVYGSE
jgi:hypothetical protein